MNLLGLIFLSDVSAEMTVSEYVYLKFLLPRDLISR